MSQESPLPVTILTGFLGAGKTTFLNKLLHGMPDEKVAVIINEFGDTSIDSQLVIRTKEEIVEINSGCICCNVRSDVITENERKQLEEQLTHMNTNAQQFYATFGNVDTKELIGKNRLI